MEIDWNTVDINDIPETIQTRIYLNKCLILSNKYRSKYPEKFNCECGGVYGISHRSHHLKTKKHIKFQNQKDI